MPKAILEFNLPEDEDDFKLAKDGQSWWSVCRGLEQYLRDELKYHCDNYTQKQLETIEKIRDKLTELTTDRVGIADIDDYV